MFPAPVLPDPITRGTIAVPGRTGTRDTDAAEDARSMFQENERMLQVIDNPEATYANSPSKVSAWTESGREAACLLFKVGARKLHGRMKFRGLDISVENRKGSKRHWYDPHSDTHGHTTMLYPYGYIRRTRGMDGDHVDVFVGPNEDAPAVYVILTNKAPEFKEADEEKCFLGFDSEDAAKDAFRKHYDKPGFFRSCRSLPFDEFVERVLATGTGDRKKVALDISSTMHGTSPSIAAFASGTSVNDSTEHRGLAPPTKTRGTIHGQNSRADRIDHAFGMLEIPTGNAMTTEPATPYQMDAVG